MSWKTWLLESDVPEHYIGLSDMRYAWDAAQAEMREPGPCGKLGHLKANLVQDTWGPIPTQPPTYHCTICEEIRLKRAAALRMAAEKLKVLEFTYEHKSARQEAVEMILALISASDSSALDEEIRLAVEKALADHERADEKLADKTRTGVCLCGAPRGRHFESDPSCPETGCRSYTDSLVAGDTKPGE